MSSSFKSSREILKGLSYMHDPYFYATQMGYHQGGHFSPHHFEMNGAPNMFGMGGSRPPSRPSSPASSPASRPQSPTGSGSSSSSSSHWGVHGGAAQAGSTVAASGAGIGTAWSGGSSSSSSGPAPAQQPARVDPFGGQGHGAGYVDTSDRPRWRPGPRPQQQQPPQQQQQQVPNLQTALENYLRRFNAPNCQRANMSNQDVFCFYTNQRAKIHFVAGYRNGPSGRTIWLEAIAVTPISRTGDNTRTLYQIVPWTTNGGIQGAMRDRDPEVQAIGRFLSQMNVTGPVQIWP